MSRYMDDPIYRAKVRAQVKAYQAANPEKVKESGRRSRQKHKAARKVQQQQANQERWTNPSFMTPLDGIGPLHETSYQGAHKRVHYYRGMASLYQCFCGKPAFDWAWCHVENQYTRIGPFNGTDRWYSLCVWDYFALCRKCHLSFDRRNFMLHDYEVIQ